MTPLLVISEPDLEAIIFRAVTKALNQKRDQETIIHKLPEVLSMAQTRSVLGMGRKRVMDMVHDGRLTLLSAPGAKYRFSKKEVLKWT